MVLKTFPALFFLFFCGSNGLKDVRLEGPSYIRLGETLKLRCNYDTETESLYALKFYLEKDEFYRFLPKEVPSQQVFPVSGIMVDLNSSDDHNVLLKNASIDTTGKFKCMASSEGSFQTLFDVRNISTVVIGYDAPKLFLEKQSYHPGEIGKANCTLEKTYPTANITWYINEKQVDPRHFLTRVIVPDPLSPLPLTSTVSTLIFNVSNNYSPMSIKCRGELYDLYAESSLIKIQPRAPSYSTFGGGIPDPLQRANGSTYYRGGGSSSRFSSGESHLSHLLTAQVLFFLLSPLSPLFTSSS